MSLAKPGRMLLRIITSAVLISAAVSSWADDLPQGWSGKGQAGYVMSRGNSDSDAANAKMDLNLLTENWKHNLLIDGLYGRSAGITSAERWDVRLQSNYNINTRLFSFGALAYQDDRFSGFVYQVSATGGIGYKVLDATDTKLALQVGVGYRNSRTETLVTDTEGRVTDRIPLDTESEIVGVTGLDFMHQFNAYTKVTDKLITESGSSNTSLRNDLALEVKMSKALSLAAGYSLLDNTNPAPGVKQLDQITTLNVVYAFPKPIK